MPLSPNLPPVEVHDLSYPYSQSHIYFFPVLLASLPNRGHTVAWSVMSEAVTNTLVLQVDNTQKGG